MIRNKSEQSGFTLLELVVVIAIAGTILAGALSLIGYALGYSRDHDRKTVASQIDGKLELWSSNNSGVAPATTTEKANFETTYLSNMRNNSTNTSYSGNVAWYNYSADLSGNATGAAGILKQLDPDEVGIVVPPANGRTSKAFACIGLEIGGNYCTGESKQVITTNFNGYGSNIGSGCVGDCLVVGNSLVSYHTSPTFSAPYNLTGMAAGNYTLQLNYGNAGSSPPPPGAYQYNVNILVNGVVVTANQKLEAPDNSQTTGSSAVVTFPITLGDGNSVVTIQWTNDAYSPGQWDANFQINTVNVYK